MATNSITTILILGGTSGIGLAFAQRLLSLSKSVIITGRREDRLVSIATQNPGLKTYVLDFEDIDSLPHAIDNIFACCPDIDAVFLNAGIQYASDIKNLASTEDAKVMEEVSVNVTAPMIVTRHVVPKLLARSGKPGMLLFNSSGLGFVPVGAMFPVYCATKAAIHHYAVGLRQALKGTNVSVIEIVPPFVGDTDLGLEYRELVKGLTPMPLAEFTDEIFKVLKEKEPAEIKEVTAGSGVARVEAWRMGVGRILEHGLGG